MAKKRKHGGTEYYRSGLYAKTGLFFPVDDYVALFNSCTSDLFCYYSTLKLMAPFEKLQKLLYAQKDRAQADLDAIYAEAVNVLQSLKLKLEADKNGTNDDEKENIQQN